MTAETDVIPWRDLALRAAVGAAIVVLAVLVDVQRHGGGNLLSLVQPGAQGPSAAVIERDFPDVELPDAIGHDGQQFYAVARYGPDLRRAAQHLDRPTYRLGRPLLPALARVAYPPGAGYGLLFGFLGVGALTAFGLGLAGGALVTQWGGSVNWALAFPLLPGTYLSLRLSVADALSTMLVLAVVAATVRWDRAGTAASRRLATAAAIAAVLARESSLLPLAAFWAFRGVTVWTASTGAAAARAAETVRRTPGAIAAASVAVTWAVLVRATVDDPSTDVREIGVPFGGLADSVDLWLDGRYRWAAVLVPLTLVVGLAATVRGLRSATTRPVAAALAATLGFSTLFTLNVIGLDLNGPRTTMPIAALAVAILAAGPVRSRRPLPSARAATP